MDGKTITAGLVVFAGLGVAGYFGYRYAKDQGAFGALAEGPMDHNAQVARLYYGKQANIYKEQQMLRRLGQR